MVSQGVLVQLEVKSGMKTEAEEFFRSLLTMVRLERATTAWFAVRFGRSSYGIFGAFEDEAGREAHLNGTVAHSLAKAGSLLARAPRFSKVEILQDKLPGFGEWTQEMDTKGVLLTLKARPGHEEEMEELLTFAAPAVRDEPKTTAWFALRLENGEYGIFDVFPNNLGRLAHLTGQIPRELARHALTTMGGVPNFDLLSVVAEKLPT